MVVRDNSKMFKCVQLNQLAIHIHIRVISSAMLSLIIMQAVMLTISITMVRMVQLVKHNKSLLALELR